MNLDLDYVYDLYHLRPHISKIIYDTWKNNIQKFKDNCP